MGLLDMNFPGNDTAEGQGLLSAAMSLLSAQRMPGQRGSLANALGQAGQAYMGGTNAARKSMLQNKYMQAQLDENDMQNKIRQAALERDQRKRTALPNLFGMVGNGALTSPGAYEPSADGMGPTMPRSSAQPGQIDWRAGLQAGYTPAELTALAGMQNLGRPEVARTVETMENGRPVTRQLGKFGEVIGDNMEQWKAPVSVNQGDRQTFIDPVTMQPRGAFAVNQSAAERDASARGWAGVQNARDANGISLGLKEIQLDKAKYEQQDRVNLRQTSIAGAEDSIGVLDKAITHPGRATSTGLSGTLDPRNYSPGTDAKNFGAVLDQIKGKAFMQAYQGLRGGGQITEVEGKKATDAIARLNTSQSDAEFLVALKDLRGIMSTGYERLSGKSYTANHGVSANYGEPNRKTIVKTGVYGGKKVVKYSDGSTDYAD